VLPLKLARRIKLMDEYGIPRRSFGGGKNLTRHFVADVPLPHSSDNGSSPAGGIRPIVCARLSSTRRTSAFEWEPSSADHLFSSGTPRVPI
jgi:hypothetical protein